MENNPQLDNLVDDVLSPILKEGRVYIPEKFKKVKIDVGLSVNAPNSEFWTNNEDDVYVIGFEASSLCYNILLTQNIEDVSKYPDIVWMKKDKIFKNFFPINCALSKGPPRFEKFYNTGNCLGCSSLFEPTYFPIVKMENIAVITLENFFDKFPWEQIPYIDQLKVDAQGSDFNILLGAGNYLNNIVYITVENTTSDQYKKQSETHLFTDYLKVFDFKLLSTDGPNSTYLNNNHLDKCDKINFFVENK